ncbi:ankyrin repeat-containing domain protein [Obelidium mucronatum]|nr:ankyrin repeat-containing domain protein [Obelidium mucronatum]
MFGASIWRHFWIGTTMMAVQRASSIRAYKVDELVRHLEHSEQHSCNCRRRNIVCCHWVNRRSCCACLRTKAMDNQPTTFACIPAEVVEGILVLLPIDINLVATALASKQMLAPFLLTNTSFARRHLTQQAVQSNSFWEFLNDSNIKFNGWVSFPFTYQTVLYQAILTADPLPTNYLGTVKTTGKDPTINVLHPRRYALPPALALKIMTRLVNDPFFKFDVSCQTNRPFRWAAYQNQVEVVDFLLRVPGVDPAVLNNQVIGKVAEYGFKEMVERLLMDPRVDPTADGNYAIQIASEDGHVEVVRVLLEDGRADPAADMNYAVSFAAEKGRLEVVKLLLMDPRVDPSDNAEYSLMNAIRHGHLEVVKLLLGDSQVDPSAGDGMALSLAIQGYWIDIVALLLSHPLVDPTANDNHAFRIAMSLGLDDVLKLLFSDGRIQLCNVGTPAVLQCIQDEYKRFQKIQGMNEKTGR